MYGDAHLGHARPGVTYDVLVRMFRYLGYKVRYVRNITDVGHLEHDADEGEDKIAKKAKLESLEPMEVAQEYTLRYQEAMRKLNTCPPSIEPRASGHIMEQIALVEKILKEGFAYESNGSVYFDVRKYDEVFKYGELSGRVLDDMISNTRDLDGQSDKRSPLDFALWKKASAEHIMRWPSPWSDGFPGWHLECSAMSQKYLGDEFDIHGGGMDLLFPHHECEMAQNKISRMKADDTKESVKESNGGVRYWMHNNMITIDGKKMGKSYNNFITLEELFTGRNNVLEQPYSPMTIRFFILQAHYRSTLDFSNSALQAAEKGLKRIMQAVNDVKDLPTIGKGEDNKNISQIYENVFSAICDDLNTPVALSHLFDAVRIINQVKESQCTITDADKALLEELFLKFIPEVLGLVDDSSDSGSDELIHGLVDMILDVRKVAKSQKDFATSDLIRDKLKALGIQIKDTKDGVEWTKI